MRIKLILATLVVITAAGCRSKPVVSAEPMRIAPPAIETPSIGEKVQSLGGVDLRTVYTILGQPDLQVREGDLWRLQFRAQACVITVIAEGGSSSLTGAELVVNAYALKQQQVVAGVSRMGYTETDSTLKEFCVD